MMKAAQLRQAILQAAVQGKLVPQNPHDEPASVLLERMRAEKAKLIKEGKLKKEKPQPPITQDEIPYDLPNGWVWCRLGDIALTIGGFAFKSTSYTQDGARVVRISDFDECQFIDNKIIRHPYIDSLSSFKILHGDILLAMTGGTVGKSLYVTSVPELMLLNQRVALIRSFIMPEYVDINIKSPKIQNLIHTSKNSTNDNISMEDIREFCIPIPSVAEQQRIVAEVKELMAMCDELEAAEKELDALDEHFMEYLPKSILQAAVQGKLVPQNPSDEPASVLLERIRAEKAKLIKAGKLKKEKPLPPITADEIPYDLPDGWEWCRLGEIINLLSGRDLATSQFNSENEGIPYVTGASALCDESILIERWTTFPAVVSEKGDLLVSCKGTVGKMAFNDIGKCHIARQIMAVRIFSSDIDEFYLSVFIKSYVSKLAIQARSIIPGISREDILNAMVPLPPLAEQQRIVAKVDELMTLCANLKTVAENVEMSETKQTTIIPLGRPQDNEPLRMAARGTVNKEVSEAHRKAREDMFNDD